MLIAPEKIHRLGDRANKLANMRIDWREGRRGVFKLSAHYGGRRSIPTGVFERVIAGVWSDRNILKVFVR